MEMMWDEEKKFWWKIEPFLNCGRHDRRYVIAENEEMKGRWMDFSLNAYTIFECDAMWKNRPENPKDYPPKIKFKK